jgi:cytochrome P450
MSEAAVTGPKIPDHVPRELVQEIDLYSPGTGEGCPYARLAKLTSGPRALFTPPNFMVPTGAWVLTRAEDIRSVLQKPEIFSSEGIAGFSRIVGESWPLIPLELDPPEHSKFRAILNGIFSPKVMAKMEDGVRERAASLIDAVADQGECEFVEAFGRPFPVSIFMQLMGLPDEDMGLLNGFEHDLLHSREMETRVRGAQGFYDYLKDLMRNRRAQPTDDLATFVVNSEVEGRRLSDDEVMGIYYLLVVAGLDTVAASLGLHFRHLAMTPEHQTRLRAEPELIPSAVEEFLRRYGIVATSRFVTQETEVAGVTMKVGDRLSLMTYLASLDPDEFPDPLAVDLDRSPNRHVAFAYGPHRCIGSHLARRELIIAQEEWLKRIPPFRIKDGVEVPVEPGGLLGVSALPLVWG